MSDEAAMRARAEAFMGSRPPTDKLGKIITDFAAAEVARALAEERAKVDFEILLANPPEFMVAKVAPLASMGPASATGIASQAGYVSGGGIAAQGSAGMASAGPPVCKPWCGKTYQDKDVPVLCHHMMFQVGDSGSPTLPMYCTEACRDHRCPLNPAPNLSPGLKSDSEFRSAVVAGARAAGMDVAAEARLGANRGHCPRCGLVWVNSETIPPNEAAGNVPNGLPMMCASCGYSSPPVEKHDCARATAYYRESCRAAGNVPAPATTGPTAAASPSLCFEPVNLERGLFCLLLRGHDGVHRSEGDWSTGSSTQTVSQRAVIGPGPEGASAAPAYPGFRVVGRSGPGVPMHNGTWIVLRGSGCDPRRVDASDYWPGQPWTRGDYDILAPAGSALTVAEVLLATEAERDALKARVVELESSLKQSDEACVRWEIDAASTRSEMNARVSELEAEKAAAEEEISRQVSERRDAVKAWAVADGQRASFKADLEAQLAGNAAYRKRFGARDNETMEMFFGRLVAERDAAISEKAAAVLAERERCWSRWKMGWDEASSAGWEDVGSAIKRGEAAPK